MDEDKSKLGPDAVRDQVRRIIGSCDFDASKRNRIFLQYVVEETLEGQADRIKAYNIATSVFGRDKNFDPQLDLIVRIEAGRLRRSLERYYLTAGAKDPIRITIPKGWYIPAFEAIEPMAPATGLSQPESTGEPQAPGKRGRAILVMPFEEDGDHSRFRILPVASPVRSSSA